MKIESINFISADEFNSKYSFGWQNTTFGEFADDGEYIWVDLTEEHVKELYDNYAWYVRDIGNQQSAYNAYLCDNTIRFIHDMWSLGYHDEILVHCYY